MRRTALTLSAAALSLAVAAVVHAGPPGSWTPVTSANLVNIDQVGLARTADGLHVVWLSKNGNKEDLRHTTILPSGTGGLAHNSAVVARWSSLSNASIVVTSSGLQAFWGGLKQLLSHIAMNRRWYGPGGWRDCFVGGGECEQCWPSSGLPCDLLE